MLDARPLFAAILICLSMPAAAETLTISGTDPASANVNDLFRVAVERFDGEDGAALAHRLEASLGNAQSGGLPFYTIVAPESAVPVDGLVTGTTRASVDESNVTEKRKRCTEYDATDKKKCLKEIEVDIRCRRRTINVATTVRLVAVGDGSIRYTRPLNSRDQVTYCPDRSASRSVEEYIDWALGDHVGQIRRDLAPVSYNLAVRVEESRKGLSKQASERFREAVRLTKSDATAACAVWADLTRDGEPTAPVAFNLGLCAEQRQDFDAAVDWYGEARRLGSKSSDIAAGLARIERQRRAMADWDARQALANED